MSETGPQSQPDEALVDLLIKQVTEGLAPAEQRALDALDDAMASEHRRAFERAAAAVSLAGTATAERLPAALRARLEVSADDYSKSTRSVSGSMSPLGTVHRSSPKELRASAGWRRPALGWFAAAAALLLAVFGWLRPLSPSVAPVANVEVVVPPLKTPVLAPVRVQPLTPAQEREALQSRADTLKVTLGATKDAAAAGVTGDVVWDPVTQKGFMRLVGLKANDVQVQQYQMWVFDGGRDKRYPVAAGLFNVSSDTPEVIIPISATLPIRMAKAFAVTVEEPGGAVVSALKHVVVLGTAG